MPKRRIDPTTGEPELTYREQTLIDEFVKNGGNGSKAAESAGYGAARPGQSAYQVLHRPEVQRRIRERIAESRVSADEIIGTLASFMRGNLADFLDQSGEFSLDLAKQKGIAHLIKSISVTTREIEATKDKPAHVVRTYRAQLHPPIQAARILARIFGIDRPSARPDNPGRSVTPAADAATLARDNEQRDFNRLVWLDGLITDQMRATGLSRSEVTDNLIQIRPEIAKYLIELDSTQAQPQFDEPTSPGATDQFGLVLDFIIELAQAAAAAEPVSPDPQRSTCNLQPSTPDQQAATSDLQPPSGPIPTQDSRLQTQDSKTQPLSMFSPGAGQLEQATVPSGQQQTPQTAPNPSTQDSRLQTQDSKTQLLSMFRSALMARQSTRADEQRPRTFP